MPELSLEALSKRVERQLADGPGDWDAAAEAARQLREAGTFDFEACRQQREFDLQHAEDHLR